METYSNDPSLVKASILRIMLFHPKYFILWGGLTIFLIVIAILSAEIRTLFLFMSIVPAARLLQYCQYILSLFTLGDSNLGMVLRPNVYAIPANLRMSSNGPNYPAIKVMRHKIPKTKCISGEVGTYIPTVSFYVSPKKGEPHWGNVVPIPLTVGTKDFDTIQHHVDKQVHLRSELDRRLSLLCLNGNEKN